eukprot:COSAG01_NODE_1543_length_9973_cov_3.152015_1_plen_156_part_00
MVLQNHAEFDPLVPGHAYSIDVPRIQVWPHNQHAGLAQTCLCVAAAGCLCRAGEPPQRTAAVWRLPALGRGEWRGSLLVSSPSARVQALSEPGVVGGTNQAALDSIKLPNSKVEVVPASHALRYGADRTHPGPCCLLALAGILPTQVVLSFSRKL